MVARAQRSTAKPIRARAGAGEPWQRFPTCSAAASALGVSAGQISKALTKRGARAAGHEVELDRDSMETQGDLPGERWAAHPDDATLRISTSLRVQHKNTSGLDWGLRKTPPQERKDRAPRVFVAGEKRLLGAEVRRVFGLLV